MSKNRGVILEPIRPGLNFLGGIGSVLPDITDGNGEPYLPEYEGQSRFGLESMNCVQFSRLNNCETWANFYGRPLNLSDRFLYWASGCSEKGNTFTACDYGLRQEGCCDEMNWPWLIAMTRDQYGSEPPDEIKDEAKRLLDEWDIGQLIWVPITVEDFRSALRRSPVIWVCNSVHAFVVYRVDSFIRTFDTYGVEVGGKGTLRLDQINELQAAYIAPFTPKVLPMFPFKENTLYQLVEGKGGFILYANGRLYYDDVAKILASWLVRNNGRVDGMVGCLKLLDIKDIKLFNLKNESVTY